MYRQALVRLVFSRLHSVVNTGNRQYGQSWRLAVKQGTKLSTRVLRVAAAGGIVLGVVAPGAAAFAADYPGGGNPPDNASADVGGTQVKDAQVTQVKDAQVSKSSGSLPFTGGDVAGLAAIGGGAAVVGGVLVMQSRRRRVSV
jgi:hypothetical protein